MRSESEILATAKAYRAMGMLPPALSAEEQARAFGDPQLSDQERSYDDYEDMLVDRYQRGLPLSKDGIKRARRRIRETS